MDISQEIVEARRILSKIEMLNANPELGGRKLIYDTLQELNAVIQVMMIRTADYLVED